MISESELGWNHHEPVGRVAPAAPVQQPRGIPVASQKQSSMILKAIKSFGKMPAKRVATGRRSSPHGMRQLVSTQAIKITHRKLFR
jgi:hypothetical protein